MPNEEYENFMTLLKEGKIEQIRSALETQKAKSKYSPDTIEDVTGKPPRFKRKGKLVELGNDGIWRLKE